MRRVIPILLMLVVLLPQAALAGEWVRCRHDRKVRVSCCCGPARADEPLSRPELRGASCCDL
ncbi:MAG TPA: hypothetical protein VEL05_12360, partial [Candidatus Acidoferrum sp.]|nr:hypothetical protein [Candidatus Acidoferrum sp.]